ncbi:hypothetical protein DL98DRAFT_658175 [Cadophora sp. DSE1049]|nr:hypothetical protein DL98DRAFT_658175 [Cadophora sp. DSE1049]
MMFSYLSLLPVLLTIAHLVSAQQPTPFIPATHTGYSISIPTSTTNTASLTSQTPHFLPPLPPTFRLSNSKEAYAASIYLALTSVQSTWTAGPDYPSITAAVYEAAPTTVRSSLSQSGYNWPEIVSAPWYNSVDPSVQAQISQQEEALQNTFNDMVAEANAEAKAEADGSMKSGAGMVRRDMLTLGGRGSGKGSGWALGMGLGMGFVVGVWLVGGF